MTKVGILYELLATLLFICSIFGYIEFRWFIYANSIFSGRGKSPYSLYMSTIQT